MDLIVPGRLIILIGRVFAGPAQNTLNAVVFISDIAVGAFVIVEVMVTQAEEPAAD